VVVGAGPLASELQQRVARLGLQAAVRLVGAVAQDQLARWYSAADLLVLASSREGWPNVLLESMACGTPVVASQVGGVPEVVCSGHLGQTAQLDTADDVAQAVLATLARRLDRQVIRQHALAMGWQPVSAAQRALFRQVAAAGEPAQVRS
jgi:glycosyltransferase involved in cell wall biosynthesis